jgi:ribosomal-protein-alanine N-acetyltransferase
MSVHVSLLEERHLAQVLAIESKSQTAPWSEQSFRNEMTQDHGTFLVLEQSGEVVGFAGMWLMVDEAHIITVAVDPDQRGRGFGKKLVVELLLRAQEQAASCATLEVRVSNEAAIGLYETLGFTRSGIRKRYYPDNREDALVMWLHDLAEWTAPLPKPAATAQEL